MIEILKIITLSQKIPTKITSLKNNFKSYFLAFWSEWTECLGSCVSSRRRVCSKLYGCEGSEYEEKKCENADEHCFQPINDKLPNGIDEFIL